MALSGSISQIYTAQTVIDTALRKLGVLGEGETSESSQFTDAARELTAMLKTMQMDGPNLWAVQEGVVTLVSGTQEYTFNPRPRTIENMRFAIDGVERRPLTEWSRNDWDRFPNKAQTGSPNLYIINRQRTATTVKFWPVPSFSSGTWTVPYSFERVLEDITGTADDIDIPQEAFELCWNALALRLAVDYQLVGQPHVVEIEKRTTRLYELFTRFDRRGDVEFQMMGAGYG